MKSAAEKARLARIAARKKAEWLWQKRWKIRHDKLIHLLVPKTFTVYCRPGKPIGDYHITNKVSKANCANCLTAYRRKTTGNKAGFRVCYTPNRDPQLVSYVRSPCR